MTGYTGPSASALKEGEAQRLRHKASKTEVIFIELSFLPKKNRAAPNGACRDKAGFGVAAIETVGMVS